MRRAVKPPPVAETPTLNSGALPTAEVRERMVTNQVRAARDWNETAEDIVVNNIINENQEMRDSRRELLVLVLLVLVLLVVGSIYTYRTYSNDRFVARERTEASNTPYRPETIR